MAEFKVKTILVPVDLTSEVSGEMLNYALFHAKKHDADIIILNVTDDVSRFTGFHIPHTSIEVIQKEVLDSSQKELDNLVRRKMKRYNKVKSMVVSGKHYEMIIEVAKEQKVDLIIMGTSNKSAVDRFFMGTTSLKVLRYAPCSVLVYRK